MITRRGSTLWAGSHGEMINQFHPGDIVRPVIAGCNYFTGIVQSVSPKLNKVIVSWAGGSNVQHDPDEILLDAAQTVAMKSMMTAKVASRRGKVAATFHTGDAKVARSDAEKTAGAGLSQEQINQKVYSFLQKAKREIHQRFPASDLKYANGQLSGDIAGHSVQLFYRIIRASNGEVAGLPMLVVDRVAHDLGMGTDFVTGIKRFIPDATIASDMRSRRACFGGASLAILDDHQTRFLSPDMEKALNEQVGYELYSAYLYFAVSAWFNARGLAGFAAWMNRQGQDEIGHSRKVLNYLVDSGSNVAMPPVQAPMVNFNSVLEATKAVLDHEISVTHRWQVIGEISKGESNAATCKLVQDFMTEQIEEEDQAVNLYQRVQMADTGSGVLILDMELKERNPTEVKG